MKNIKNYFRESARSLRTKDHFNANIISKPRKEFNLSHRESSNPEENGGHEREITVRFKVYQYISYYTFILANITSLKFAKKLTDVFGNIHIRIIYFINCRLLIDITFYKDYSNIYNRSFSFPYLCQIQSTCFVVFDYNQISFINLQI